MDLTKVGYCHPVIPAGLKRGDVGSTTEKGHLFAVTYKENIFLNNKYIYTGRRRECRISTDALRKLVIMGPTRLMLAASNFKVENWKISVSDTFPNNCDTSGR